MPDPVVHPDPPAPASPWRPVVVLPTFNNAGTLIDVLRRTVAQGLPLIVVNDGSTDATASLLAPWQRAPHPVPAQVLTHPRNRGKAAALHTGFAAAASAGYTHALTLDTDGQLDPEDLPRLAEIARRNPRALVVGVRDDSRADYPSRSRLGRRVSNGLIRRECGLTVTDSQCGLRVYPLALATAVRCRAARFGYETEIITRACWAGYPIREVPVNCRYFTPPQRVSHFRPFADSLRIIGLHGILLGRRAWQGFGRWISPAALLHQVRRSRAGQRDAALGLAAGVFVANLPAYGLQTILAAVAARLLRVHPLPAIAGAQLSTPPLNVLLIASAVLLGHRLCHGAWLTWAIVRARVADGWLAFAGVAFLDWLVGALVLGLGLALSTFILARLLFALVPVEDPQR